MSTIRLGSSCSPLKTLAPEILQHQEEETDGEDACDPNKLLQCPYDKNHQIRACRFPYHLIKCCKNHPKLARELKACPFNARHLLPSHELAHHIANCVDGSSENTQHLGSDEMKCKWQVPVSTWANDISEEDWEKEADDVASAPFVWGVSTSQINQIRPEQRSPTNSVAIGLRTPKTLPWKFFEH